MKKYQNQTLQEELAKQLVNINVAPKNKKHLLRSTLSKLDNPSHSLVSDFQPASKQLAFSKLIFFLPTVVVGLALVAWVTSPSLTNRQNSTSSSDIATSSKTKPNGSVDNTINAVSADALGEAQIENQAISEALLVADQITKQASSIAEVTDEKGL